MELSVIIPVYNGEEYLEEAVKSVLNQPWRDLEVICVNDGSTDNSVSILESIAKADNRVHIVHQKNQGVAEARNRGIDLARGKYVAFLDQDDRYCRDVVTNELIERIRKMPFDLVSFSYYHSNQKMSRGTLFPRQDAVVFDIFQRGGENYRHHSSYFYRTDFLRDKSIRVDRYRNEDERFRMQAIFQAEIALYVSKPIFIYRNNRGSVTHQKGAVSKVLLSCIEGYRELLECTQHPAIMEYCKELIVRRLLGLLEVLAYESGSSEVMKEYLIKYKFEEYYNCVWKSKTDENTWNEFMRDESAFIRRMRKRYRIMNCLRFVLHLPFMHNLYEMRKYSLKLNADE